MIRRRKAASSRQPELDTGNKTASDAPIIQLRSEIAELWLKSRETVTNIKDDPAGVAVTQQYRKPLTQRPFNKRNLKIALRLARLECRPIYHILCRTDTKRLKRYLLTQILVSLAPAAKVQAMASLLNLVQRSLSNPNEPISYAEIGARATLALFFGSLGRILPMLIEDDVAGIQRGLDESIQIEYIQRKLSMDIPTAVDSYVADLAKEAGVFSGFAMMEFESVDGTVEGFFHHGLFDFLRSSVFAVFISAIEFVSVSGLLVIVCLDVARNPDLSIMAVVAWIALILVLAFLPIIYGILHTFWGHPAPDSMVQETQRERLTWIKLEDLRQNVLHVKGREEIVLFRLADWMATRWSRVIQGLNKARIRRRDSQWKDMLQHSIQESGQIVFYVSSCIEVVKVCYTLTLHCSVPRGPQVSPRWSYFGLNQNFSRDC
jgi:hypothetical protein